MNICLNSFDKNKSNLYKFVKLFETSAKKIKIAKFIISSFGISNFNILVYLVSGGTNIKQTHICSFEVGV